MKMNLNDGDAYIEGRSPEKAQGLLEKLEEIGRASCRERV